MHTTLIELVKDPTLIPHVYDYCDHWCRYCRASGQCLVYRTSDLWPSGPAGETPEEIAADGLAWARAIADATGTEVAMLDVELSDPAFVPPEGIIGHRLERLGRQYMLSTNVFLQSIGAIDGQLTRDSERSPIAVLAWFHLTIASKIFRALVSQHRALHGQAALMSDAVATAKLVLTAIDESRAALAEMERVDPSDQRIPGLDDYLALLSIAVEKQFPGARSCRRVGIDASV